jgi:prephenate dehydratase
MRIAHLGPAGTYTEVAARAWREDAELAPVPSVATAIDHVIRGDAEAAVCAVENSIEGTTSIETLDLVIGADFPLQICGEVVVGIRHMLVGAPGTDAATATEVHSHPQALLQCRKTLATLAPNATPRAAPGTLAIGNERSAELYGAAILARDIGDEPGNETRFIVLSREAPAPTGDDKTSLAFTTEHDRPGSLVEVLLLFANRGLNMTRIESRPTRRQLGTYIFLVDVQGHRDDPAVVEAMAEARAITQWLRVLGSYPRWTETA